MGKQKPLTEEELLELIPNNLVLKMIYGDDSEAAAALHEVRVKKYPIGGIFEYLKDAHNMVVERRRRKEA